MSQPSPSLSSIELPFTRRIRLLGFWLNDHGFLRIAWRNFHRLDAEFWRHNQPDPARLIDLQRLGARSVLSLRGREALPSLIEASICEQIGLTFHSIPMQATVLPAPELIADLLKALRDLPKPLVVHCKSGSDRTGLAATLYLHVLKGHPIEEARRQFALRYVHNRWGPAGKIHKVIDAYAAQEKDFETWLAEDYDPAALDHARDPAGPHAME